MIADGGGGGGCPQRGRARPAILVLMYGADKKVNNGLTPPTYTIQNINRVIDAPLYGSRSFSGVYSRPGMFVLSYLIITSNNSQRGFNK